MTLGRERLLKLAKHLETGRLGHDEFNFTYYHSTLPCGTSGCAIGECPYVFPDQWIMLERDVWLGRDLPVPLEKIGLPILKVLNSSVTASAVQLSAVQFFEITEDEFRWLFLPATRPWDVTRLPETATRYDVAARIREFLKRSQAALLPPVEVEEEDLVHA